MNFQVDHDVLNDALQRCGASWTAAQAHGLFSSRLAVSGTNSHAQSLSQVLEGSDASDALRKECEDMLAALWLATHSAFSERQSAFEPLLADDGDSTAVRAEAVAHWCEGYLHGLVSGEHESALRKRLAADPLADIIKDMLQITRAAVDDNDGDESDEESYVEIIEYLRVAAQLVYEELAEYRPRQPQ